MLADYLPQNVNKVLYLDGDILVLKDLKLLYDVNLNGKAVGMCDNQLVPEYKMYKFEKPYFNSGVILIDLNLWRKQKLSEKCLKYLHENIDNFIPNSDTETYFLYPDQDLINIIYYHKYYKRYVYFSKGFIADLPNNLIHYFLNFKHSCQFVYSDIMFKLQHHNTSD